MVISKLKNRLILLLVFIIFFIFYLYSLALNVGFTDTVLLINDITTGTLSTFVNNHALTILIGRLFYYLPFFEIAHRINLMSAVVSSVTLVIFFKAIFDLHQNYMSAIVSTLALALSYSYFWHSVIIENYIISALITTFSIYCYVSISKKNQEWWFYPLFSLFGIGILNHMQLGFLGLGIGAAFLVHLQKIEHKKNFFIKCLLGFTLGLIPWVILLIKDTMLTRDFLLVIKNAFMGPFGNLFFGENPVLAVKEVLILYLFEFPSLYFFIPILGLIAFVKNLDKRLNFIGLIIHFFSNTLFFTFYGTWDKYAFLLQSFLLLVFFGSFIFPYFLLISSSIRVLIYTLLLGSIFAGQFFYSYVINSARNVNSFWSQKYSNNYSHHLYDQTQYILEPSKRDYNDIKDFCDLIFKKLPINSVMLDDDSRSYYPLANYFQKYFFIRNDIRFLLMNSWGIDNWGFNTKQILSELEKNLKLNKSFFIITLNDPYMDLIFEIIKSKKYVINKFMLSNSKWIYQVEFKDSKSLNWNLTSKDITNSKNAHYLSQLMTSFNQGWDNNDQLFVDAKDNSLIEFKLNRDSDEIISLIFNFSSAPDYAAIDIFINNKKLIDSFDLFNPKFVRISSGPILVKFNKGENLIKIVVHGKNSLSQGYKFAIDSIDFLSK